MKRANMYLLSLTYIPLAYLSMQYLDVVARSCELHSQNRAVKPDAS